MRAVGLLASASCTIFNGLSVPSEAGVGKDGDVGRDGGAGRDGGDGDVRVDGGRTHTCEGGVCPPVKLASSTSMPTDIAVDEADVYWTTAAGDVGRVPKTGGMASLIVSGVPGGLARIAVDATHVYYRPPLSAASGAVFAAKKDGTGSIAMATNQPGNGGMASDGNAVYWATFPGTNIGTIQRAPLLEDGSIGPPKAILSNLGQPDEIAVDSMNVYYQEYSNNQVSRARSDGGAAPVVLACDLTIRALAVDDASVYWTEITGQVTSTATTDTAGGSCMGATTRVLATEVGAFGIAASPSASAGDVFYTSPSGGTVWSAPKTGPCTASCPRELAHGQPSPMRVVADGTSVYWVTSDAVWTVAY